jgi:hypothetical protein
MVVYHKDNDFAFVEEELDAEDEIDAEDCEEIEEDE